MLSKVYVEDMFKIHHRKRKGNEAVKVDTHVFDTFSMSCSGFSTVREIPYLLLILSLHHYL